MVNKYEKDTTQEQREKVLLSNYEEHNRHLRKAHNHKLWLETRGFVETLRPEILAMKRREIVNSKKADRTVS